MGLPGPHHTACMCRAPPQPMTGPRPGDSCGWQGPLRLSTKQWCPLMVQQVRVRPPKCPEGWTPCKQGHEQTRTALCAPSCALCRVLPQPHFNCDLWSPGLIPKLGLFASIFHVPNRA